MHSRNGQTIWDITLQGEGQLDGVVTVIGQLSSLNVDITPQNFVFSDNQNSVARYFADKYPVSLGDENAGTSSQDASSNIVAVNVFKSSEGQSVWDIALTKAGSIELLSNYLILSNLNVDIPAGTEFSFESQNSVSRYLADKLIASVGDEVAGTSTQDASVNDLPLRSVNIHDIVQGQSVWDLVVNYYGQVEDITKIISNFDLISDDLTGEIEIAPNTNSVARYFVNKKLVSRDLTVTEVLDGLGFDYVFDFAMN